MFTPCSSLCTLSLGLIKKGLNPNQTPFKKKEHMYSFRSTILKIYKFSFINYKILYRMVYIAYVVHEPITVQGRQCMAQVLFSRKRRQNFDHLHELLTLGEDVQCKSFMSWTKIMTKIKNDKIWFIWRHYVVYGKNKYFKVWN